MNTNENQAPYIIHLGKKSRKQIKKYKKGIGGMVSEVQQCVEKVKQQNNDGKEILPIVVTHRKKKRKSMLWF